MVRPLLIIGFVAATGIAGGLVFDYASAPRIANTRDQIGMPKEKTVEERIAEAKAKSENIHGVYMTYGVAVDHGVAATRLRNGIEKLLETTELNAVVIDVKEVEGTTISDNLKATVDELHSKGAWVIARMTMFRDNSQTKLHPEYYVKRKNGDLWHDNHGNFWLDAASKLAWDYDIGEMKKAVDLGFDEVQMDYVRFPSDGNMQDIVYPAYDGKSLKYESIKTFLAYVHSALKSYKPELILSADLFGYVSTHSDDLGIGQRLVDIGDSVDYISFMLYPSHYYVGFEIGSDKSKNLPALYIPYKGDPSLVVSSKPYDVVYRSIVFAYEVMTGMHSASTTNMTSTTSPSESTSTAPIPLSHAKVRPWLQDFDLEVDRSRGIYYDAVKVESQIQAAENAGSAGWLLWNASNVYTAGALQKK